MTTNTGLVNRRRGDVEILRHILQTRGEGPTAMRRRVALNYPQYQKYLTFLDNGGFVTIHRQGPRIRGIEVTDKGHTALEKLMDALDFLGLKQPEEQAPGRE